MLINQPISRDPNAEKLALKYDCNIVMSNSAFVYLIYNLSMLNSDDLKICVTVREYATTG
jgi:hypothetical protein